MAKLAQLEGLMEPRSDRPTTPPPAPTAEQYMGLDNLLEPRPARSRPTATVVDPALFSVLERYTLAQRNGVTETFDRMFSTRPGAKAVAPKTAATVAQLNAAGTVVGLVAKLANQAAMAASLDAEDRHASQSQCEAAGDRARAAVWKQSGVPVDMRPMSSGVLGAELTRTRQAQQEDRLWARDAALKKADKADRGQLTTARAAKAGLDASAAGPASAEPGFLTMVLDAGVSAAKEPSAVDWVQMAGAGAQALEYQWAAGKKPTDPMVSELNMASAFLGGALSVLTAVVQLRLVTTRTDAGMALIDAADAAPEEDRARSVAIRGAADNEALRASIAGAKSVAATISAMGNFLSMTPAGPILKIIGFSITAAVTIADVSTDSYRAGTVAEKAFEGRYHGDAEEAAQYVLRYGGEDRAESLLRKGLGGDGAALKALEILGVTPADLARVPKPMAGGRDDGARRAAIAEIRSAIIKRQGLATKNLGTRLSEGAASTGVGEFFSDAGGGIVQWYRGDIAERTHRAKEMLRYNPTGKRQLANDVRAKAFFRLGSQVDNERKAQLEIVKVKRALLKAKQAKGEPYEHTKEVLDRAEELLAPQSYYQALKADAARKVKNVKTFGPGTAISAPA